MHTIYRTTFRTALCALIAGVLLLAPYASARGDTDPPDAAATGAEIQATFTQNGTTGTWQAHASGSYDSGVTVKELYLYGEDDEGTIVADLALGYGTAIAELPADFRFSLEVQKPDPSWAHIGLKMQFTDADGIWHSAYSEPFPAIWDQPVLIDHLQGGSVVEPSNYVPGDIPAGVGIPHALLHGLANGVYYAVVFFDGMDGCPSDKYAISAFIPGEVWGADIRGPNAPYAHSYASAGGGCMQEFYVDSTKGDEWMWGALSSGLHPDADAVADSSGIPAFAICGTEAACDRLTVRTGLPEAPTGPTATSSEPDLVSSVLFLPGMKGSRLYENNPLCLIPGDSCDIPMWLPLADAATPGLYMGAAGTSRKNLYVHEGGLLSEAFGRSFYASFTDMLDQAQEDGTFGEGWSWKPVAYDWRMSLPDLVHNGAQDGNRIYYGQPADMPYIEKSLRALASSSPTGKAVIVAHSNGGLVAKALMQELGDEETARLVDSVIFVGVPQSGAPRALGALLFGDSEGIPGIRNFPDILMSASHAREFARAAPVAYHLLPSATYMEAKNPSYPLMTFDDSPLFAAARSRYGETVDTAAELDDYARGGDGRPIILDEHDLQTPATLAGYLLDYAKAEHAALDVWAPPEGVNVYEIGGHSTPTISGIDMYEAPTEEGDARPAYRPLFTFDGDGTVPVISSLMMDSGDQVHALWADLESIRSSEHAYGHADLMEAPAIQETVKNILRGSSELPPHISAALPEEGGHDAMLAFFLHSPASLSVADHQGNRDEVNSGAVLHEDIPGGVAGMFGDVSYVLVPADAPYDVTLDGQGTGTFTLDVQELGDGGVTASSTFAEMPVTERTLASLSVDGHVASTSPLAIDGDGDGTVEIYIGPKLGDVSFLSDRVEPPMPADPFEPAEDPESSDEAGASSPDDTPESSSDSEPTGSHRHHARAHGDADDAAERAPLPPQGFSTSTMPVSIEKEDASAAAEPLEQDVPDIETGTETSTTTILDEARPLIVETDHIAEARESFMQRLLRLILKFALKLRHLASPLIP